MHPIKRLVRLGSLLALPLTLVAAFGLTNRAAADTVSPNTFGAMSLLDPSATPTVPLTSYDQTVAAGTSFSVDLIYALSGYQPYGYGYGVNAVIDFDPTILQVVSVTTDPSSPWQSAITPTPGHDIVPVTGFDNTAGDLDFAAQGAAQANTVFAVATITFDAIGDGTTGLDFTSVQEYLTGYGPFGTGGNLANGSVTVEGSAAVPDTASTLALLSSAFLGLAALRRRFARA